MVGRFTCWITRRHDWSRWHQVGWPPGNVGEWRYCHRCYRRDQVSR